MSMNTNNLTQKYIQDNSYKTTFPSLLSFNRKWFFLDLKGKIGGRIAPKIVEILRGKNKKNFSPNSDLGDYVVLINAKHVDFTGNKKLDNEFYYNHSGYPGGLRKRSTRIMLERYPEELVFRIVKGMMPHTKLGDKQLERLFIFADEKLIKRNKTILQPQEKNFIKINL